MRASLLAGTAAALCLSAPGAAGNGPEPWVADSRAAAQSLGSQLMGELQQAMTESVPAAIRVCSERAPAIAAGVSEASGATVGRSALRYRNPDNAPGDWQQRGLESLAARIAAGEDPATMEFTEVVTADGVTERRWMKPIMTAPLCLVCHGAALAPEVAAAIAERYPEDRATGFASGDLRGAFHVAWRESPAR